MIVECFVNRINGLAENFIWSNDDMVFVKPIPEEFYFQNNKTVHRRKNIGIYPHSKACLYHEICGSTADFISSIFGNRYWAEDYHMPIPLHRSLIDFLWSKYSDKIYTACKDSKIRKKHNFALFHVPHTIDEIKNFCVYQELNIKTSPIWLSDKTSKNELENLIKNNHIVCFNDSEMLINKADEIANYIKELL
jgi:hypothetical protein